MSTPQLDRLIRRATNLLFIAGAGTALVSASAYTVQAGHRAVIFDRLAGVKQDIIQEGMHFLIPWLQKPIIFDVRTTPRNITATTGSKGTQLPPP